MYIIVLTAFFCYPGRRRRSNTFEGSTRESITLFFGRRLIIITMLFRFSLLAALFASAAATVTPIRDVTPTGDIPADSKLASKIMSKARKLDGNADDAEWVAGYDIRFVGCHETTQFAGEDGQNAEDGNPLYTQRLVHFYLCPSGSCSKNSKCSNGGEYIVDMGEFLEAYLQAKLEAQEWACEQVANYGCYNCDYNDDERCQNQCYRDQGMDYCIENDYDNGDEFELERAAECAEMDNANGNDNIQYFVGPYCSGGNKINLGVFMDETCTTPTSTGVYAKMNYGNELPYASESLVSDECISCKEPQDNDGNNNAYNDYDEDEVTELCERMYEMSGKCEEDLKDVNSYYFYPNTKACDFIHTTLPKLEKASRGKGAGGWAITFLVLFGLAACGLGYYAWTLHKKLETSSVDLSAQTDGDRYATMT